jgi:GNAT superfamily N-acetyltransferase
VTIPSLDFRAMGTDESELIAFRECFERNGTRRRLDALRWQYFDNPAGARFVRFAVCEERLAAIYAVQPALARAQGTPVLAAQSVDTLVDADFRGRGLFTKMAEAVYRSVRERGGAFVYGFPNANSAPGFFQKLGWVSLDPVPFLVRPVRTAYFASKLPLGRWLPKRFSWRLPIWGPQLEANQELRPIAEIGPELNPLWKQFASNIVIAVERSPEYLRWRLAKPGERYQCVGVFEARRLIAFCAYTTVDKHGGRIGYVVELLHDPDRERAGAALLVECARRMAADGADALLAWCFDHSPNAGAYRRAGFFHLPERLRPIELHIGVRPLDESLRSVLCDRRNWYISYCDSDTV